MKIKSLKYIDHSTGWRLDKTEFGKLSLLVGISGVGKTKILEAITNIRRIANGEALRGVEWEVDFCIGNNRYFWAGEYENRAIDFTERKNKHGITGDEWAKLKLKLLRESLLCNGDELFIRNREALYFNKKQMPRLAYDTSALTIFQEEDVIAPVKKWINKISASSPMYKVITLREWPYVNLETINELKVQINSLEDVRNLNLNIVHRLYCLKEFDNDIFNRLMSRFISIFPMVEKVGFYNPYPDFKKSQYILSIKEKHTDWIESVQMSSGMFRALMFLAELELSPEGSVMLIDEFENSLGVNCIDTVAEYITDSDRDIQFIITSHHPYIINNIGMQHWKIVQREGSRVFTSTAEELKLGRSKHQAFMQLMNSPAYENGIS